MADKDFEEEKELTNKGNQRPDEDIFEEDDRAPDHSEKDLRELDIDDEVEQRARKVAAEDDSDIDEEDDDAADGLDGGAEAEREEGDDVPDQDTRGRYIDPETKRPYGERMQRKIGSEVAKRKAAEARAADFEKKLQERDGKDRDRAKTESERAVTHFDGEVTRLTDNEKTIKASLKKAHEDGDSDAIVEATDKLQKNNIALEQARYGKTNAEGTRDRVKKEAETRAAGGDSRETVVVVPRTQRWLNDQAGWFNANGFAPETAAAKVIEAELAVDLREGRFAHDANSDQYWREVNRRVKSKFPNLKIKGGDEARRGNGETPRLRRPASPIGGSRNQPANDRRPSRDAVTLNDTDKRTMRSFGLDPSSPRDQKAYADEKRRGAAAETRDREGE